MVFLAAECMTCIQFLCACYALLPGVAWLSVCLYRVGGPGGYTYICIMYVYVDVCVGDRLD